MTRAPAGEQPPLQRRVEVLGNIGPIRTCRPSRWPRSFAYTGLLFTWLLVALRTAKGSLRGNPLKLPPSTAPVKASKQHAP